MGERVTQKNMDAQTNTVMISVAQSLYDGDSVISYDIALNQIQDIAENISLNNQGYGFICDKEGLVVAHSNILEKGKNYLEDAGTYAVESVVCNVLHAAILRLSLGWF